MPKRNLFIFVFSALPVAVVLSTFNHAAEAQPGSQNGSGSPPVVIPIPTPPPNSQAQPPSSVGQIPIGQTPVGQPGSQLPSSLSPGISPLGSPTPSPASSLEQLYPVPTGGTAPYSASSSDPTLTEAQKKEAETVPLSPIPASELLPIGGGKLPPIKLEASFNEPVSLKKVLRITLENNLPIRISAAGYDSQKYLFWGAMGRLAPDYILTYRGQSVNNQGSAISRVYTTSSTVRFPVFQGGRVVYGILSNLYRTRAAKSQYYATVNDALLDAYRRYYDLVLNQTLLQIRVKSVELSRTQLRLNEQLKNAGVGTNFAIYQSRTQLALDKQAMLQQQVVLRQSALALAQVLNTSMAINFVPQESEVRELRLIQPATSISELLAVALRLRPELKQYENLRLAANRNVQIAQAPLYPTMQFFSSVTETQRNGGGSNSGGGGSGASGLGGSTVIIPTGGGGGGIGISGGGGYSVSAGFDLSFSIPNMGIPDVANTMSARALARQALLQSNQQYLNVVQQVRSSYLNMLTAKEQVQVAAEGLVSSTEQLRLANLRVTYGQGINLELIQAQRDYVTALTTHAQAVINYNIAQAQLLRDTGLISVDKLTTEYPRPISVKPDDAVIRNN